MLESAAVRCQGSRFIWRAKRTARVYSGAPPAEEPRPGVHNANYEPGKRTHPTARRARERGRTVRRSRPAAAQGGGGLGHSEQRAGARPALRRQPQHRLAAARNAGGARARRARRRDRGATRSATRPSSSRRRRITTRSPDACGRCSSARPRPPARSSRSPSPSASDSSTSIRQIRRARLTGLDEPPHPAARDVVGQGLPGLAARGRAGRRAAGHARALHLRTRSSTARPSTASSSACDAMATPRASASTTTPTASRRRSSTRITGRSRSSTCGARACA